MLAVSFRGSPGTFQLVNAFSMRVTLRVSDLSTEFPSEGPSCIWNLKQRNKFQFQVVKLLNRVVPFHLETVGKLMEKNNLDECSSLMITEFPREQ